MFDCGRGGIAALLVEIGFDFSFVWGLNFFWSALKTRATCDYMDLK
jgi:hypothetical protein